MSAAILPVMTIRFFAAFAYFACWGIAAGAQNPGRPPVGIVDVPTVKVLRGLTVPEFEAEMQLMNQALGVACGHCHAARNNFASEENPRKAIARGMIEMVQAINTQYFPDYRPGPEESRFGKVTCFTCHQGLEKPKAQ
jgi:Photosynthetic reaction centre cytochrome C subunit